MKLIFRIARDLSMYQAFISTTRSSNQGAANTSGNHGNNNDDIETKITKVGCLCHFWEYAYRFYTW